MSGPEERIRRGRPPGWLIAVFLAVAAVVVAGLAATGYRGQRSSATTTTTRPPNVAALVARADAVVVAEVDAVHRLGDPSDPAVMARLAVERTIKGSQSVTTVYDKGFKESWRPEERVLLFLRRSSGTAAAQAQWQVQHRYRFDGSRLVAPFSLADVLAAARSS